jgi:MFS transporter, DHA2 family, multidrug resistance protein
LTREDPIADISLLWHGSSVPVVVTLDTGTVLIATTQMLPQLLQTEPNYTATMATAPSPASCSARGH